MSCSSLCIPSCGVAAPALLANTANEPCIRQCPDSTVVIQHAALIVTFPGHLTAFPQSSVVGLVGVHGMAGGHGTYGGYGGFGGLGGYGVCTGYGLHGDYGYYGGYGALGSCGYGGWCRGHRYLSGNCGPC
ncbi:LOW QUALITY PROTEIN: uncharacterized protein RDI95_013456 [Morus bassanus]